MNASHKFYLHKLFGVGVFEALLKPHRDEEMTMLLSFGQLGTPLAYNGFATTGRIQLELRYLVCVCDTKGASHTTSGQVDKTTYYLTPGLS